MMAISRSVRARVDKESSLANEQSYIGDRFSSYIKKPIKSQTSRLVIMRSKISSQ